MKRPYLKDTVTHMTDFIVLPLVKKKKRHKKKNNNNKNPGILDVVLELKTKHKNVKVHLGPHCSPMS